MHQKAQRHHSRTQQGKACTARVAQLYTSQVYQRRIGASLLAGTLYSPLHLRLQLAMRHVGLSGHGSQWGSHGFSVK